MAQLTAGIVVDGVDLQLVIGYVAADVSGYLASVGSMYTMQTVPGRDDALYTDHEPPVEARLIPITGTLRGATRAALVDAQRRLVRALRNGLLEVVFPDRPDLFIRGRVGAVMDEGGDGARLLQRDARLSFTLNCADPRFHEVEETEVVLNEDGIDIPLGNAAVRPLITISGPAVDPVLTYRDYTAETVAVMDFTGTTLLTGESLVIDTYKGTIADGDGVNMAAALVSGSNWIRFAAGDAQSDDGPYPTLAISSGTAVAVYRKAWE